MPFAQSLSNLAARGPRFYFCLLITKGIIKWLILMDFQVSQILESERFQISTLSFFSRHLNPRATLFAVVLTSYKSQKSFLLFICSLLKFKPYLQGRIKKQGVFYLKRWYRFFKRPFKLIGCMENSFFINIHPPQIIGVLQVLIFQGQPTQSWEGVNVTTQKSNLNSFIIVLKGSLYLKKFFQVVSFFTISAN